MQLLNETGMLAGYTLGRDVSGQERVVVVVKGTFSLPRVPGEPAQQLKDSVPLVDSDIFTGEPGLSSPLFEVDYAPTKEHCDVTVVGSAYAPDGQPAERVMAGIQIGSLSKLLYVYGQRYWMASPTGFTPSRAQPFESRLISYDIAFGGVDRASPDERQHDPYMKNPVGIGYHSCLQDAYVDGTLAPSTEACNEPVERPDGQYKPMSLGPLGRSWSDRSRFAGTYDEQWLEDTFPLLPADFDDRYYQSAPLDQQIPYPQGGELVKLLNLTPDGKRQFSLPEIDVPVCYFAKRGEPHQTMATLDTLVIEPDKERFTLTWRSSRALQRDLFEIPEILAGSASRGWWRARKLGKDFHPGLHSLIRQKSSAS